MVKFNLAPVFVSECRRLSRRSWHFVVRCAVVTVLLAGLAGVWWTAASRTRSGQVSQMAQVGIWSFECIAAMQVSMVLLAAPALAAGTFTSEMARGHVSLMLVTGLTPAEIVLGTLCARVLPVLATVACVAPVLALISDLGGIPPAALVRLEVVTAGMAVFGCALALSLSVVARRLYEALMGSYLLLLGWVLGYPTLIMIQLTMVRRLIPSGSVGWFLEINPYWLVLQPILGPHSFVPGEEWGFLGWMLLLSAAFTGLAVLRLCPGALGASRTLPLRRRPLRLPPTAERRSPLSSDFLLIFWRESGFRRQSGWVGILWGLYIAGATLFTVLAVSEGVLLGTRPPPWTGPFNGFQTAVGLGLLALVTPAALAEERISGSLQVLLSTPLSTSGIVLGKWFAYYRTVVALTVLPTSVAIANAFARGRWAGVALVAGTVLAHGAAVTSLGIALATWVSRIDRALILSATALVLVTAAWVPLAVVLVGENNTALGLASASPLLGIGVLTNEMAGASDAIWPLRVGWAQFWILAMTTIALALLGMTLATFDRCLGRITPVARPSDRHRARRTSLLQV